MTTKRTRLHKMEEEEYRPFYRLIDEHTNSIPYYIQKTVIESMMVKNKYFSIAERETNEYLGYICLQTVEDSICNELGITLEATHRNKGIATEVIPAFLNWIYKEYGINRIIIRIEPHNHHSKRLFEKLGAVFDGKRERKDPVLLKLNEIRTSMGQPKEALPQALYYHFDLPIPVKFQI